MQAVRQSVLRQLVKPNGSARRGMSEVSGWKAPTMNDMPAPIQSWAELNAARQAKYNKHLVLGVGFFIATLAALKGSGLCYLNYSPPAQPAPKNN
ncbi:uncharacterized protein LOC123300731 [Chrysoperla carnea]|uniref:uncharacterized protein LOC123300731 n=1 Tax=Chrysoperla carnea TaxID=189513 RepID=UPI001D08AD3D|nr:uncharacterized protein LOC123300731 [Chrysoperla carnea]